MGKLAQPLARKINLQKDFLLWAFSLTFVKQMRITPKSSTMRLILFMLLALGFTACTVTNHPHNPEGHGFLVRAGKITPTKHEGVFIIQGMDVNGKILGPRFRARFKVTPHVGDCVMVCRDQIMEPKF